VKRIMRELSGTGSVKQYRIGDVARLTGLTADTLRYYERIGLMNNVGRVSGVRRYNERDLSCLRFIQRAQKMNFKLVEIGELLKMRAAPHKARAKARALTVHKLAEVETQLEELQALRDELQLLLNLCASSRRSCAIIKKIDRPGTWGRNRGRRSQTG
jgi:DNA-binding transcriptional MerR regulator